MQLNIFDAPYVTTSETSREAATSMKGKTANLRSLVLEALRNRPMTDEQIATSLALSPNTARPRRVELVRSGHVVEVGKAVTASGRSAVIWGVK
jgi:predicted ArsR family transcriptional regulator